MPKLPLVLGGLLGGCNPSTDDGKQMIEHLMWIAVESLAGAYLGYLAGKKAQDPKVQELLKKLLKK